MRDVLKQHAFLRRNEWRFRGEEARTENALGVFHPIATGKVVEVALSPPLRSSMMEVVKTNFDVRLPEIVEAINEADFVAIDMELTGIGGSNDIRLLPIDTPTHRYSKYRASAQSYKPNQFGLCTFRWDSDRKQSVFALASFSIPNFLAGAAACAANLPKRPFPSFRFH